MDKLSMLKQLDLETELERLRRESETLNRATSEMARALSRSRSEIEALREALKDIARSTHDLTAQKRAQSALAQK